MIDNSANNKEHDIKDMKGNIENIVVAIMYESGDIDWITPEQPSKKQVANIQKIFVVTRNPSILVSIVLFIEITLLKILNSFEIFFKRKNNEK